MAGDVLLPDFEFRLFLENATRIGECFGIFFFRNSDSSSGGTSFVALVANSLLTSPRHVTGVNAAAKATVSTSARTTVARIIAVPPMWNLLPPAARNGQRGRLNMCQARLFS